MKTNHEIDYIIHGEEMQCVEIELDPQEAVIAEPGSFMMMTDGIQMQTLFGDGNESGFMSKLFSLFSLAGFPAKTFYDIAQVRILCFVQRKGGGATGPHWMASYIHQPFHKAICGRHFIVAADKFAERFI